ncbi:MAG: hypothetical protein GXP32_05645 [Kiritimatiellaeota bacterium]|nr:hypothetical protein [Kiritimatiellota bacterium]
MNHKIEVSRYFVAALAFAGLLIFSGCIKKKVLVRVKPDGSGHIVVAVVFNKSFLAAFDKRLVAQREKLAEQGIAADSLESMRNPLFNEQRMREKASQYGKNVEFKEFRKVSTASGRGYIVVYSFKNIDDVQLDLHKILASNPSFNNSPSNELIKFSLKKSPSVVLKVTMPKFEPVKPAKSKVECEPTPLPAGQKRQMMLNGNMFGLTGKEKTQEEAFRKIFDGMRMSVDLEVEGELLKSNASLPDSKNKSRCVLFSIDYTTALKSNRFCGELAKGKSLSVFKCLEASGGNVKGIEFEKKNEITMEFKAK